MLAALGMLASKPYALLAICELDSWKSMCLKTKSGGTREIESVIITMIRGIRKSDKTVNLFNDQAPLIWDPLQGLIKEFRKSIEWKLIWRNLHKILTNLYNLKQHQDSHNTKTSRSCSNTSKALGVQYIQTTTDPQVSNRWE